MAARSRSTTKAKRPSPPSPVSRFLNKVVSRAEDFPVELRFPWYVWNELMAYIELCPTEISGLGELTKISQNVWKVEQVFLLEQEVTNNNTEFDKAARAKFYSALAKENEARVLDGQPKRCIGLQWHSHVWGGAHFASGGDAEAIDSCTAAWRFWMVLNKQGEYSARLDTYGDVRTVLPVSVKIIQPAISDEAKVACQAQIDELVKPAPALMFPTIPLGFKGGDYGEGFGFRTLEDLDFI